MLLSLSGIIGWTCWINTSKMEVINIVKHMYMTVKEVAVLCLHHIPTSTGYPLALVVHFLKASLRIRGPKLSSILLIRTKLLHQLTAQLLWFAEFIHHHQLCSVKT
ncbi:hypothetical protein ES703_118204 [subsurface metagenome]